MKLHIWLSDEPLSDDADGATKIYADIEFVVGHNVHEGRSLVLELAEVAHRTLLANARPPTIEAER